MGGVDEHAVAHDADDLGTQDAGGQQIQDKLAARVFDSMAGIVAALIAHNDVVFLAQQVYHAALAFVAPVDTGNCSKHCVFPFILSFQRAAFSVRFARDPPP